MRVKRRVFERKEENRKESKEWVSQQERIRWIENEWWGSDVVGGARGVPKILPLLLFFFFFKSWGVTEALA